MINSLINDSLKTGVVVSHVVIASLIVLASVIVEVTGWHWVLVSLLSIFAMCCFLVAVISVMDKIDEDNK